MSTLATQATHFPLPWRETREDQLRTWGGILSAICAVIVLGIVVPFVNLPQEIRVVKDVLTMTRVTLAPPEIKPVPPPPVPKTKVPTKVEPTEHRVTPTRAAPRPAQPTPPAALVRDEAAIASMNAIDDAFADMRQPTTSALKSTGKLQRGAGEAATADRALLTANQGTREIATGGTRGEVGGVALSGRAATRVSAPQSSARSNAAAVAARNGSGGDRAGQRSLEEIRRVFDANKGLLFGLYQAALIDSPGLSGKVVVELTISPGGDVLGVKVVSSEIDDQQLVQQVIARVRGFHFKPAEVGTTTVTYPVHFLPT